jgi:hypothetical protein
VASCTSRTNLGARAATVSRERFADERRRRAKLTSVDCSIRREFAEAPFAGDEERAAPPPPLALRDPRTSVPISRVRAPITFDEAAAVEVARCLPVPPEREGGTTP